LFSSLFVLDESIVKGGEFYRFSFAFFFHFSRGGEILVLKRGEDFFFGSFEMIFLSLLLIEK
jgi:hypothetical protein